MSAATDADAPAKTRITPSHRLKGMSLPGHLKIGGSFGRVNPRDSRLWSTNHETPRPLGRAAISSNNVRVEIVLGRGVAGARARARARFDHAPRNPNPGSSERGDRDRRLRRRA